MAEIPEDATKFDATYHIRRQGLLAEAERLKYCNIGFPETEVDKRKEWIETKSSLATFIGGRLANYRYPKELRVFNAAGAFTGAMKADQASCQKEHVMERQFVADLFIHYVDKHCNGQLSLTDLTALTKLANSQANLVLCPVALHAEKSQFFNNYFPLNQSPALVAYFQVNARYLQAHVQAMQTQLGNVPFAQVFLNWVISTPFCNPAAWTAFTTGVGKKWQISMDEAKKAFGGDVRPEV